MLPLESPRISKLPTAPPFCNQFFAPRWEAAVHGAGQSPGRGFVAGVGFDTDSSSLDWEDTELPEPELALA
jgi:hypothetical protein